MAHTLITLEESKSQISEAYRTLRTNIQFTGVDSQIRKLLITSAGRREGKSTTVANLAVSMAQAGKSVLVIDADLRNPSQHKLFGLDNKQGLSIALLQNQDYQTYFRDTAVSGVRVLTGGFIPPNPAELVGSNRMKRLLAEATEQFDIVLIDTPPIIAVTDAAILAQEVDGVVLVMASGEVNKEYAKLAKELLDKVGAKILGAVLNKMDMKASGYYCYYHESVMPKKKYLHKFLKQSESLTQ